MDTAVETAVNERNAEIAQQMKTEGISYQLIAKVTGLNIKEIEAL